MIIIKGMTMTQSGGKPKFELSTDPTPEELRKWKTLQTRKAYREKNPDKIKQYNESKKKWAEKNREKQLEIMAEWYEKNKEKRLEKIECKVCKRTYARCHKSKHEKTKYHNSWALKIDKNDIKK